MTLNAMIILDSTGLRILGKAKIDSQSKSFIRSANMNAPLKSNCLFGVRNTGRIAEYK